jgi:hypothetical protein
MSVSMLSREAFEASQMFIESTARPLEIARFKHAFAGGPVDPVFDALRRYQNSDGGFGHALEPDLRASESSTLCTSIAFQILRSIPAKPDNAFVSMGIKFFLETLDRTEGHWRIIPTSAEQSPHAPWWNQTGRENSFDSFSLNPSAEILGYLYDFKDLIPGDILSLLSDRVLNHLSGLEKIEMHDLICCIRLLQTETLPEETREPLHRKLAVLIPGIVASDPEQWFGYSLRPLQVVDSPDSLFMSGLEEAVAANLNYEVSSQNKDGSWTPTWTWGGAYPDDWKIAQCEWSGILTLEKLLLLKKFGRIERIS